VAVFTLTFPDALKWHSPEDWKEAKRRFHSFRTHVLPGVFSGGVGVWEPSPTGRIHLHAVVGSSASLRGSFDFGAFKAACEEYQRAGATPEFKRCRAVYVASATDELRAIWATIRERAPDYEIGRCETIPVRSPEGFGFYVGKYLGKVEGDEWAQGFKGRRLTRWGDFQPGAVMSFAWCRRLSAADRAFRPQIVNPVGMSATLETGLQVDAERRMWQRQADESSGFRSFMRGLIAQGMTPHHTADLLKAKFGAGWAWRLMLAHRAQLEEAARDVEAQPGLAGHEEEIACAEVVRLLHLYSLGPDSTGPEESDLPPFVGDAARAAMESLGGRVSCVVEAAAGPWWSTVGAVWASGDPTCDQREQPPRTV
jgi:hypothetical protein